MTEKPDQSPFAGALLYRGSLVPSGPGSALETPDARESDQSPSAPPEARRWLKLSDAAQALGVSEITIRRRVKAGRIEATFKGGRYYVFVPEGVSAADFLDTVSPLPHLAQGATAPLSTRSSPAVLSPYASEQNRVSEKGSALAGQTAASLGLKGPSDQEIIVMLKAEIEDKEAQIQALKRELNDQMTLNAALEAALEDALGGTE